MMRLKNGKKRLSRKVNYEEKMPKAMEQHNSGIKSKHAKKV